MVVTRSDPDIVEGLEVSMASLLAWLVCERVRSDPGVVCVAGP